MTKAVLGIVAFVGLWGSTGWGVEPGGQAGSGTTATTAAASEPQRGAAPAGVEEAVQEAVKLPPGSGQFFQAATAALSDWVKKSPAEAYEWAGKQEKVDRRRHYLPLVVMRLWVRQDVQGALEYVAKAPGNQGLGGLAASWGGHDPAAASAWAAKQPQEKWPVVIYAVGEGWAQRDAKAAGAWLLTLPLEQGRYAYAIVASNLAWTDPAAAAEWVGKLPECEERNTAVGAVASVWGRKRPGDAAKVKEWVKAFNMPEAKKEPILQQLDKAAEKK